MASITEQLNKKGLLRSLPKFLESSVQYEVIMGSIAYGVSEDSSDMDVYGFAIPPRDMIFPHMQGYIEGFDEHYEKFNHFQQHHIIDDTALGGKGRNYDLTLYSIVRYFRLLTDCNPNIIDSLFVPRRCVLFSTKIGEMVRENRHLFLHKGCWSTFKGYAYTQMHKMKSKQPEGKRLKLVEKFGFDVKFAYHVVRLLNEVEQIMMESNLELDRNNDQLKSIRRGEWSQAQVESYFFEKERHLEHLYLNSRLPALPDVAAIKVLLLNCLEQHYGSLEALVNTRDKYEQAVKDIKRILDKI